MRLKQKCTQLSGTFVNEAKSGSKAAFGVEKILLCNSAVRFED